MKWSGGPIVAEAQVQRFAQFANCTAELLQQQTFGYRLYELDDYWASVRAKGRFFAVVAYLEHERWLDRPFTPGGRSRGESWIVLSTPDLEETWLGAPAVPTDIPLLRPEPSPSRRRRAITPGVRFAVFRRDGFTCQYCGRRAPNVVLHVDHVLPVVAGGTNDLTNLRTACSVCNLGKGSRRLVVC